MEFDTKQVIEQSDFIQTADANIAFAMDPQNDIVEGMEGVRAIVDKLDEVEAGTLQIQPPLDKARIESYREKTTTILSIGQRAIEALNSADSERVGRLGRLFKGVGIASKR